MAAGCEYVNGYGIKCGLPADHAGNHEQYVQLIAPDPFCLQPWDPFTSATIRAWISAAVVSGVSKEKVQRAEEHFAEIKRWQSRNGTRLPS